MYRDKLYEVRFMKAIKIDNPDIIAEQIKKEIKASAQGRYFYRLFLLLLFVQGIPIQNIAKISKEPLRNIQRWIKKLNNESLEALQDQEHSGRPPKLTEQQLLELKEDITKDPHNFYFPQKLWDGPLLRKHIENKYAIRLSDRQCQRYINKFNGHKSIHPKQ